MTIDVTFTYLKIMVDRKAISWKKVSQVRSAR